ncbi:MAG: potassium transporter Kup [Paracoccaceae bacterium]
MTDQTAPADAETGDHGTGRSPMWLLVLSSIGVVYGDIGTSPLYALRESLHVAARGGLEAEEVVGVVSLLIWTIFVIVTLKYVILILRADNNGEGGTLSLVALAQRAVGRRTPLILAIGVLGTALFFGDAIITPAISVLSAVEGLELVAHGFTPYVIPLTLVIITGIFIVQKHGTDAVSRFFGPIMVLWFGVMAVLGLIHIGDEMSILRALNPWHGIYYVGHHGLNALPAMGAVFLAVTGVEALYADMGHFGRRPIRIAWSAVVAPALTLSYLGQGALVLAHPETAENPFFLQAPEWALLPLVVLATAATVIAAQAVISGAFSMAQQAVQLGLLPRLTIQHTSETQRGQVYLPGINRLLFAGVIILVLSFGSSARLAAAYGIAVTGTMITTTILSAVVFRRSWNWPWWALCLVSLPLFLFESAFLIANLQKVLDGGWLPLALAAAVGVLVWIWVRGTAHVLAKSRVGAVSIETLVHSLAKSQRLAEAPGTAVFLTSDSEMAPSALMHNLKHNHVLHRQNYIVTVSGSTMPYVPDSERVTLERLSDRFARVRMTFGYMEQPNVPKALALTRKMGEKYDIMTTSFFLNRRSFRAAAKGRMPHWQERIYITLTKLGADATDFYQLPTNRVVEMGQQLAI